jgi:2,3,4,5-tetrahydropyridine-2-carboxylate N-succinyltransferase
MAYEELQAAIEAAFEKRVQITPRNAAPELRAAVDAVLALLDAGQLRVAQRSGAGWQVNEWLKKAVLLSFRIADNAAVRAGALDFYDKVPLKYAGWDESRFAAAGVRVVPPATVRRGAFIAANVVLMPSYVNIGAHVGSGTMVDTWATVGSGAQIGRDVHLAGGVGIGGVLEPPGARPVIVEDGAFIGSRCIVTEGVVIEEGVVLGANVTITGSTPIIDVSGSEAITYHGRVPAGSVVIPGTRPRQYPAGEFQIGCALIVGQRTASTDRKTSLNAVLRDFGVST